MRVAVVGGRLQGVEAAYLARKAGWEVILLDKHSKVPAAGLCDVFHRLDVTTGSSKLSRVIKTVDLIIPALENTAALKCLRETAAKEDIPLVYDAAAYPVSSSKKKSDLLFVELEIPTPRPWPKCDFPVMVKPSASSGSRGVHKINKARDLTTFVYQPGFEPEEWVIQEFLEGPSYSLEVIGFKGNFVTLQTTEIVMDSQYDSKRVLAPAGLSQAMDEQFREIAVRVAEALNLTGIMDVEVILHHGTPKVLEIDARLPSQTPTVVNKSTGINMLTLLYDVFAGCSMPVAPDIGYERGVVYEHIRVSDGILEVSGEHVMANASPLQFYEHFLGADEVLTNFAPECSSWVATLIITGDTREEAWTRRCEVIEDIKDHFGLLVCFDPTPSEETTWEFMPKKVRRE